MNYLANRAYTPGHIPLASNTQAPATTSIQGVEILSDYPDLQATFSRNHEGPGRPYATKQPPPLLKRLNPKLHGTQNWPGVQLMDDTKWMWGKECYDSTSFEWGVNATAMPPRQVLRRHGNFNGLMPAMK